MHPAKATLHSAKPLPGAALGKEPPAKSKSAKISLPGAFIGHPAKTLPSANPAPGKEKWSLRRRLRHPLLCRVPCQRHPAKIFLIFFFKLSLPGAVPGRHPAKIFLFYFYNFFAGCRTAGAPGKEFFIFFVISLPGARS